MSSDRPVRRTRTARRPRLSQAAERALRARWTSGDDAVELSFTEVAILLGWSRTSVEVYVRDGRMRGTQASGSPTRGGRWTVRAGDLREDYAADLAVRRGASTNDPWI